MICEHCAINAGRTVKGRACCELRMLAQAPRHVIAAHAKNLTEEARNELRPRLQAEIERLKRLK